MYRRGPLQPPQSFQDGGLDGIQVLAGIEIVRGIPGGIKRIGGVVRGIQSSISPGGSRDAGGAGDGEDVGEIGIQVDRLVQFVIRGELGVIKGDG